MTKAKSIMDDLKNELDELHQRYPVMKNGRTFSSFGSYELTSPMTLMRPLKP